jgi:peptidoglycan hydrolase-like protein with peptidoglycan-binding domain
MTDQIEFSVAETAPVLRKGDTGPWVRYLQQLLEANDRLTAIDIRVVIDDSFGDDTDKAVRTYQRWMPTEANGVVDRAMWESLIRGAETFEQNDDWRARQTGAPARANELGPAEQIGRRGWKQVDVDITIQSFLDRPFPDSTAYVRFVDHTGASSDEGGVTNEGLLRLREVWVPSEPGAYLYLYVDSFQPGPNGILGDVHGMTAMTASSKLLRFHAKQSDGPEGTISEEQGSSRGWTRGTEVNAGIDLEIVSVGASTSVEHSTEESSSRGRSLTVKYPGTGFEIRQD